jgi:glycine/D-amino acid oxidase-like deaminating enzyme
VRPSIEVPAPGATRSFWLQEALRADAGASCPPLTSRLVADVCIVGGGFAGLWTAYALTEREPGLRIALLEQDIVGGGASGRNGGFLASSWWDLSALVDLFGRTEGLRYALAVADAVTEAGRVIDRHGIDAWFHREGVVSAATAPSQRGGEAAALCADLGVGDRMRPLTGREARAILDSPRIEEGAFVADSATVQPARLARGLRRVLLERGVSIAERTRVRGIDPSTPAVVRTDHGAVRAEQVVVTTGAWAAAWRPFRRSFAVIVDHVVVTEPIPDRLEAIGWTHHVGMADGRELLFYLRRTDDDRIAIGGGALGIVPGGWIGRGVTHDRRLSEAAARGLIWLFPQLEGVRFDHAWGGPIDQTMAFVPFYRTLPPGNVHAGLGYSGHGLSQTVIGGQILASMVLGVEDEWTSLPVARPEFARTPPEPFRYLGARAAAWALERGDAREARGDRRGRLAELIGGAPLTLRAGLSTDRRGAAGEPPRPAPPPSRDPPGRSSR